MEAMRRKRLLTIALAGALLIGAALIGKAAEVDTAWYAAQNPDVVAELGDSPEMMKMHYEVFGRKESRAANEHDVEALLRKLFKAEDYAAMYPEVRVCIGTDSEELFRHYIVFGLMEGRRPCEKVSQEAAMVLQQKIGNILLGAGVTPGPACVQLVEIITDTISEDLGGMDAKIALARATPLVESVIKELYDAVLMMAWPQAKAAVWASLSDYSEQREAINPKLQSVNAEIVVGSSVHGEYRDITVLAFHVPQGMAIPKHTNANQDNAYFFGVGIPYNGPGYRYNWGFTSGKEGSSELEEAAAIAAVNADFSEDKGKTGEEGGNATFSWGLNTEKPETARWGYLAVKDGNSMVVAKYILDFSQLTFDSGL